MTVIYQLINSILLNHDEMILRFHLFDVYKSLNNRYLIFNLYKSSASFSLTLGSVNRFMQNKSLCWRVLNQSFNCWLNNFNFNSSRMPNKWRWYKTVAVPWLLMDNDLLIKLWKGPFTTLGSALFHMVGTP